MACCPVSLEIANFLKETKAINSLKVYSLLRAYSPIYPILKDKKRNLLRKLTKILSFFVFNRYVKLIKKIISMEKPKILIVGDDGGICSSAIRFAKILKIKTIAVQVGFLPYPKNKGLLSVLRYKNYRIWRFISSFFNNQIISKILLKINFRFPNLDWGSSNVDLFLVASNSQKRILLYRGIPSKKIITIGYILADKMVMLKKELSKKEIHEMCSNNFNFKKNNKKIALMLTQPLVEDGLCEITTYLKTVKDIIKILINEGFSTILKLHPRESKFKYLDLYKEFNKENLHLIKDTEEMNNNQKNRLAYLIKCSDLVITFYSTSGLLALLFDKPLIVLDIFNIPISNPYSDYKLKIDDITKLPTLIKYIENKPKEVAVSSKKIIKKYLGYIDGKNHIRLKKIIDLYCFQT